MLIWLNMCLNRAIYSIYGNFVRDWIGMSVAHCTQTARNRQQWRKMVHSVISNPQHRWMIIYGKFRAAGVLFSRKITRSVTDASTDVYCISHRQILQKWFKTKLL